jgi:hypothetical protein
VLCGQMRRWDGERGPINKQAACVTGPNSESQSVDGYANYSSC